MTKKQEEQLDIAFMNRGMESDRFKVLLKTLNTFQKEHLDTCIYGRQAMFALCEATRRAIEEMDRYNREIDMLLGY